jgi:signal transduction histidine kinase
MIVAVLWNLYRHYRHAKGTLRNQLGVVGLGVTAAAAVGILLALILPDVMNFSELSEYAFFASFFAMGGFLLAIARYRLFDIKLAVVRSVTYVLSLTALAAIYYIFAYLISAVAFQDRNMAVSSVSPLSVYLALVLAFLFQPVKQIFDQVTDRVFFRNRYDTGQFLLRIGQILTSTTELHVVLEEAGKEIRHTLKASGSLFLVYRDHHPNELVGEGLEKNFKEPELTVLQDVSAAFRRELIVVDRLKLSRSSSNRQLHEILSKRKIVLALPLLSADEMIGYLMLGEHMSGSYTKQDIAALEAIANELVIAVQNARSVQVVRDLNSHLEQRVTSATKELRSSNDMLRRLDAAKDEFVSMASHQLRTPLTSVKGYISMVLEGDAGKISPMQKQLLEEAFMSSERMVHLISDFLNVSRLQTGKFVIEQTLVDMAELVEQEVTGLETTAEAHSLKLRYRKPSVFPSLYVDEGKIRQVVMNFIDNAIYYSKEHTTITVRLAIEDGDAVLTVHDTGIGVPKDEQARLFTKFFRAENARRQRPDGTGIGLFLAKMVITAHGGKIVFESVEGEGSTFGFRLPIKKLSEAPKEDAEPIEVPTEK